MPLSFIRDLKPTRLRTLDAFPNHTVPATPGCYIFLAASGDCFANCGGFPYPRENSPIFYIGQTHNLRTRVAEHYKFCCQVREEDRKLWLYYPRYEYAKKVGARYAFIRTWQGLGPRGLEEIIMARFAQRFGCWPVANNAGSWRRVDKIFAMPSARTKGA